MDQLPATTRAGNCTSALRHPSKKRDHSYTPQKCAIFGVCCEAIPRQINFLIDEAFDTGKEQTV